MDEGTVVAGRDLDSDRLVEADVCIIGSGAGGGVCALKLAQAGLSVVVLEEGPNVPKGSVEGSPCHVRPTLQERESKMYRLLYQDGAGRLTKDSDIQLLQGRCLGGGTTVNWAACLPPPDRTIDYWRDNHGIPFTSDSLRPYVQEVVNYLHIHRDERYNSSARAMIRGCTELGYDYRNLPNNTVDCRECGSCGTGCPYDRKQSGIVRWLPDALSVPDTPATIYTDTHVDKISRDGARVTEVKAHLVDAKRRKTGRTLRVVPKAGVILAAGALGSPSILLNSGLDCDGRVGRRTHIHPITLCFGRFDEKTHGAYGVPDNMMSAQFADGPTGYLIETGSFFPVMTTVASLEFGPALRRMVRDYYPYGTVLYSHHNSGFDAGFGYGRVRVEGGRPQLDYKLHPENKAQMKQSLVEMSRILLASGARSVYHLTNPAIEVESLADLSKLDEVRFEPQRTTMMTVHVMGGCAMGDIARDERAVVGTDFRVRGMDNLWVADGSLFPTGLGANPQVTIYALALLASQSVATSLGRADGFRLQHQQENWPWPQS